MSRGQDIRRSLSAALSAMRAGGAPVRLCGVPEATCVLGNAMAVFVDGPPGPWWWSRLKHQPTRSDAYPNDDAILHFSEYAGAGSDCWLVVDTDEPQFPVVGTDVEHAALVLREMPFVEYYLVDPQYRWMLSEDHHGFLRFVDLR